MNAELHLPVAELSYCVAIRPSESLDALLESASAAVTLLFENRNVVDARYPAHLSLILSGTSAHMIPKLQEGLSRVFDSWKPVELQASSVRHDRDGYISVDCERSQFSSLFDSVLAACRAVHESHQFFRPHLVQRWPRLSQEDKALLIQHGTYKIGTRFNPHFSVAHVGNENGAKAHKIVSDLIKLPMRFAVGAFQLVEVGHNNEQWRVIHQWAV